MFLKKLAISTLLLGLSKADATKSIDSLRNEAANADMPFFTAFLNDFDINLAKYTSYMMQHHITLPQAVADYYYHLAPMTTDIDLQKDIAQTFPFTEFQTFVTVFPWYSSLLSEAGASTIYLPDDYKTMKVDITLTSGTPSQKPPMVSSTTSSSNIGVTSQNSPTKTISISSKTESVETKNTSSEILSSTNQEPKSTKLTLSTETSSSSSSSSSTMRSKNESGIMKRSFFSLCFFFILSLVNLL